MPVQIGTLGQPGFDDPIALMKDCHRRIEHFLNVIQLVAEHASSSHLDDSAASELQTAMRYFREAAPLHTADEEQSLFPEIRALRHDRPEALIQRAAVLEAQHREAERLHELVHEQLARWIETRRLDAPSLEELQCRIEKLRALYREHIAFEDDKLFPAASRSLDPAAISRIGRAMAARRGVPFPR